MKIYYWLLGTVLVLLVSCTTVPAEKKCLQDSDCAPASCCHPVDAVNKEYSPHCEKVMCSQNCVPDTIDCGQGEIKCVNDECKVVLK